MAGIERQLMQALDFASWNMEYPSRLRSWASTTGLSRLLRGKANVWSKDVHTSGGSKNQPVLADVCRLIYEIDSDLAYESLHTYYKNQQSAYGAGEDLSWEYDPLTQAAWMVAARFGGGVRLEMLELLGVQMALLNRYAKWIDAGWRLPGQRSLPRLRNGKLLDRYWHKDLLDVARGMITRKLTNAAANARRSQSGQGWAILIDHEDVARHALYESSGQWKKYTPAIPLTVLQSQTSVFAWHHEIGVQSTAPVIATCMTLGREFYYPPPSGPGRLRRVRGKPPLDLTVSWNSPVLSFSGEYGKDQWAISGHDEWTWGSPARRAGHGVQLSELAKELIERLRRENER